MKSRLMTLGTVLTVMAFVTLAEEITAPMNFRNEVNFDSSAIWKINGTKVTASAADLNAGLASSTASLVSNVLLKVYGSNITATSSLTSSGTTTLGTTTLGATTISGKQVNTPQTFTIAAGASTLTVTNAIVFVGGHSGVATMTLAIASSPGMRVTIVNTVATNLVIDEVAGRVEMPAAWGSITNGVLDTISFVSVTTNWVCTGFSDN